MSCGPEPSGPGFPDHFSAGAGTYARYRPTYPQTLVDLLAGLSRRRELAWDAGCGSGQLSRLLTERFDRVIATDASAEQIARATQHPRVEYRVAHADASGLPSRSVDLAAAAQAAHWFPLDGYYREVWRVARPGAVLALVSYGMASVGADVDPLLARFYSRDLGPHWPSERRHVETAYRALPFPFAELEPPELVMKAEWTVEEFLGYVGTWSAVARLEKAEGRGRFDRFRREVLSGWDPGRRRTVRWPLALRLGRV